MTLKVLSQALCSLLPIFVLSQIYFSCAGSRHGKINRKCMHNLIYYFRSKKMWSILKFSQNISRFYCMNAVVVAKNIYIQHALMNSFLLYSHCTLLPSTYTEQPRLSSQIISQWQRRRFMLKEMNLNFQWEHYKLKLTKNTTNIHMCVRRRQLRIHRSSRSEGENIFGKVNSKTCLIKLNFFHIVSCLQWGKLF